MTSEIFERWIKKLDKQTKNTGRKILLIVNSCMAHPQEIKNLEWVKIFSFPKGYIYSMDLKKKKKSTERMFRSK